MKKQQDWEQMQKKKLNFPVQHRNFLVLGFDFPENMDEI